MHAAKLSKSDRLQRVHALLTRFQGRWLTTMDVIQRAQVCAVSSIMDELRENNVNIETKREGRVWSYRMAP